MNEDFAQCRLKLKEYYGKQDLLLNREMESSGLFQPGEFSRLRILQESFAKSYAEQLLKDGNHLSKYYGDFYEAIAKSDLPLIELFLDVCIFVPGLYDQKINIAILKCMLRQFELSTNETYAMHLFDQVIEIADPLDDEYVEVLRSILSLNKPERWFVRFNDPLRKLIWKAPKTEQAKNKIKIGLNNPNKDIAEEIREFISQ